MAITPVGTNKPGRPYGNLKRMNTVPGGGLLAVAHTANLTGDGTEADPLDVDWTKAPEQTGTGVEEYIVTFNGTTGTATGLGAVGTSVVETTEHWLTLTPTSTTKMFLPVEVIALGGLAVPATDRSCTSTSSFSSTTAGTATSTMQAEHTIFDATPTKASVRFYIENYSDGATLLRVRLVDRPTAFAIA